MNKDNRKQEENKGFTLVEVLISILILSMIISAAVAAFSQTAKHSRDNKLSMTALNLANEAVEYIRSLEFAQIGTKIVVGGTTTYGDPAGEILQSEAKMVGNVEYTIKTIISWEVQGGWNVGDTDWDYKSVKVSVAPKGMEDNPYLTKVIETYIARDSTQPLLTGANVSLRVIRGWRESAGTKVPVPNAKVRLISSHSSPRQIYTSTAGVARFLSLTPGTYSITINPSDLGLMLLPGQEDVWTNLSITEGNTASQEFEVEYPCILIVTLKDLDGNPIILASEETAGSIDLDIPFGTAIHKTFTKDMVDAQGKLPPNFLTGLWPVGDGYTGAYTVSNITIPDGQYLGSYITDGITEEAWNGKFDSPGTSKEILCYFGVIPVTPENINTLWVDGGSNIITDMASYTAMDSEGENLYCGRFASSDSENTIVMRNSTSSEFYATKIFFENIGTSSHPGLYIGRQSNLILHTGLLVFRGEVEFYDSFFEVNKGRITLRTSYEDGSYATYIDGSSIGGLAGVNYGKLFIGKAMTSNGSIVKEAGGYYYPNGLVLPDNASQLIPITKENYMP